MLEEDAWRLNVLMCSLWLWLTAQRVVFFITHTIKVVFLCVFFNVDDV